jgi:hypothetical protein
MIIGRIEGATRELGKPANWDETNPGQTCQSLPVVDIPPELGGPQMVSAWFPTPDEVQRIVAGEPVYLAVFGTVHPPVCVWVPER